MENKFSSILKGLRQEKGVGQEELAKSIGMARSNISFWENGVKEPTMSSLILLAKFFDVSIDYLVGLKEW